MSEETQVGYARVYSLDISQMTTTGPPDELLQPDISIFGSTGENSREAVELVSDILLRANDIGT